MIQRQIESKAVIVKRATDLKLLFVVDSRSHSENTTFKIIVFSKITSENSIVLPAIPEQIKEMTGITCEVEEIFEFRDEKYQTFAINLYSGRDIGYAIAVDESNKQLVINLAPTQFESNKGIHIIYPTSSPDGRMTFYIHVKPEDILNSYLYGGSTLDNKWFNFICDYFNWYELQHDGKDFCRNDDMNYRLRMSKYMMKYGQFGNRTVVPSEETKSNQPQVVRMPNGEGQLNLRNMGVCLSTCPISVKTFKTPIQDQKLIEGDLEITNWIRDREVISINSVVSTNQLIRTIVVKNK